MARMGPTQHGPWAPGQRTPLRPHCDRQHDKCHFCRGPGNVVNTPDVVVVVDTPDPTRYQTITESASDCALVGILSFRDAEVALRHQFGCEHRIKFGEFAKRVIDYLEYGCKEALVTMLMRVRRLKQPGRPGKKTRISATNSGAQSMLRAQERGSWIEHVISPATECNPVVSARPCGCIISQATRQHQPQTAK